MTNDEIRQLIERLEHYRNHPHKATYLSTFEEAARTLSLLLDVYEAALPIGNAGYAKHSDMDSLQGSLEAVENA